ncbi:rhamnogalacturonan acetylesterase [Enterococcus timonensis]|uniref:rhamnogalacturonan acetylesterase n=1 Tax=Enterococcus timonensis TaxID=1852364 RepID=UPI0008DA4DD9|nr:rhamnogalacturonan acetylesterase [Enterococcus timonensis]
MITFTKFNSSKSNGRSPEISDGFDYKNGQAYSFAESALPIAPLDPVSWWAQGETGQTYQITVEITALADCKTIFLFSSRKQLRALFALKKGKTRQFQFFQSLSAIMPDFSNEKLVMDQLFVSVATQKPENLLVEVFAEVQNSPRLFLAGDSTVTDQVAPLPYIPALAYTSWGQSLPLFLNGTLAIDNQAHSGLTTESFMQQGHLSIVEEYIRPGDWCLFQFGHNDQKLPQLKAATGYRKNLLTLIDIVRQKGGRPVLVTPQARNTWKNREYLDLLVDYANEVKLIGQKLSVPVIDLHRASLDFWQKLGQVEATKYFPIGDLTHTNEYGSWEMAQIVARQLVSYFEEELTFIPPEINFSPENFTWENFKKIAQEKTETQQSDQILHDMEANLTHLEESLEKNQ